VDSHLWFSICLVGWRHFSRYTVVLYMNSTCLGLVPRGYTGLHRGFFCSCIYNKWFVIKNTITYNLSLPLHHLSISAFPPTPPSLSLPCPPAITLPIPLSSSFVNFFFISKLSRQPYSLISRILPSLNVHYPLSYLMTFSIMGNIKLQCLEAVMSEPTMLQCMIIYYLDTGIYPNTFHRTSCIDTGNTIGIGSLSHNWVPDRTIWPCDL
jgi:hypothetical protein